VRSARVLLEMLKLYEVDYVFGLPGETSLPLYAEGSTSIGLSTLC